VHGISASSSGNFNSLFDGQALTAEERALLAELKQRELREQPQYGQEDDEDEDDEDEDDDAEQGSPPE
jgi:hypothetical protein